MPSRRRLRPRALGRGGLDARSAAPPTRSGAPSTIPRGSRLSSLRARLRHGARRALRRIAAFAAARRRRPALDRALPTGRPIEDYVSSRAGDGDDEDMVGKLLCVGDALHASSTLQQAPGFEVRGVPSAAACLLALEEDRFDLVIIAAALPDSSGCALRDRLRARSDLAATPILVTADHDPASDASPTPRTALREIQRMLESAEAIAHLGSWRSSPGGEWPYVWSAENYRIHGVAEGTVISPSSSWSSSTPTIASASWRRSPRRASGTPSTRSPTASSAPPAATCAGSTSSPSSPTAATAPSSGSTAPRRT